MGSTLPALLLHGQPGRASDWDWVIPELAGRIEPIALNRPGYDGSPAGGVRHSAEAALAALDARGIDRAVVAGHSYGGAVAAWLAAFHPERVAGLVLVSAAANRAALVRGDRLLGTRAIGPVAVAGMLWSTGMMLQLPLLRRRIAWATHLPQEYLAGEARASMRPSIVRTFSVEQRWLLRELPVLEDALERIGAPTRVLVGSQDPFVPAQAGRRLADQIAGAELIELPHAGHLINLEEPDRVAEAILSAAGITG